MKKRRPMLAGLAVLAIGCSFDSSGRGAGTSDAVEGSSSSGNATSSSSTTTSGTAQTTSNTGTTDPAGTTMRPTSEGSTSGTAACETMPAWWNDAWAHRVPVTVDNSGISTALSDVPVMVRLDGQRIDYAATQPGGVDVRFIDGATGRPLAFEIETWDAEGESYLWFRLPELPVGEEQRPLVWLYYDNLNAHDTEDPAQVWSNSFESVHHLTGVEDSAQNGHDAVSQNPPEGDDGLIGRAREFDGNNEYLQLPPESDFDFTDNFTIEAVVRRREWLSSWQVMVAKSDGTWRIQRHNNSTDAGFGANNDGQNSDLRNNQNLEQDTWYYVVATYAEGVKTLYVYDGVNGNVDSEFLEAPLRTDNVPVRIGELGSGNRNWNGWIDEVRLSTAARSAEWIAIQQRSLFDQLLGFGEQETCR